MVSFRQEKFGDEPAIRQVNERAFGQSDEAILVNALREQNAVVLSMVALENNQIVGHILYTQVTIRDTDIESQALGLGPMAVLPAYQKKGIGSTLLIASLNELRRIGEKIVFVLGHPDFYPKFGFVPAKKFGIKCEFDAPDEAFMVLELQENALAGRKGIVYFHNEFRKCVN